MMTYKAIGSWMFRFNGSARRSASHSSSACSKTSETVASAVHDTNVVPFTYPRQKRIENDQMLLPRSTSSSDANCSHEV